MKPSSQSSTYGRKQKFAPEFANDGKLTTKSVTNDNKISWWMVDLSQKTRVDRIHSYLHTYALNKGEYQNPLQTNIVVDKFIFIAIPVHEK